MFNVTVYAAEATWHLVTEERKSVMNHINKFEVLEIIFASRDWRKQRKTSAVMGGNPQEITADSTTLEV